MHLSSHVRANIEHFRTVSIRALAVKYVARQSLAIFLQQISFSKHNDFIRNNTSLIHGVTE